MSTLDWPTWRHLQRAPSPTAGPPGRTPPLPFRPLERFRTALPPL